MKNKRNRFATLALCVLILPPGSLLLARCSSVHAQQPKKVYRIGIFSYGSVEIEQSSLAAVRQGLRELGYLEGQNIVIEQRYAVGRSEKLPELLAELVALKVDLLVVAGDPAVHAAKKTTNTIPIVMVASPDP